MYYKINKEVKANIEALWWRSHGSWTHRSD